MIYCPILCLHKFFWYIAFRTQCIQRQYYFFCHFYAWILNYVSEDCLSVGFWKRGYFEIRIMWLFVKTICYNCEISEWRYDKYFFGFELKDGKVGNCWNVGNSLFWRTQSDNDLIDAFAVPINAVECAVDGLFELRIDRLEKN